MGMSTFVQDCSGKGLVAKAAVIDLNSEYNYEIDLEEVRILDFKSADFSNNAYTAKVEMSIAIHIDGPNNVSMRLDGEFDLDNGNEITTSIKQVLIYDTTIHYEDPESCEEVYRAIGEDAYVVVQLGYE
jgi:hypothetical protein